MSSPLLLAQAAAANSGLAMALQRGQRALRAKDQVTAVREFRSALKFDPSNAEAHANLGVIAFFQGDCKVAEPQFRATLHAAPSLMKAKALLAICERRLGEPTAQADLKEAFARLHDPKLRAQTGVELADMYYQQGELEQTASVLHTLLDLNPNDVDILFFAQRVYSELADQTLNKLAVLAPGSARMEQLIAEQLINAGDLKDAAIHYRKALQLDPRLPGMHFELAETLMEANPNDSTAQADALKELNAAIRVDGDNAKVECEFGRIALLESDADQALLHYRHAYQMSPGYAPAQMGLADVFERQGRPEQAARYLRMAAASDPLNAQVHYQLSQVDRKLHLDQEAKKELELFLHIRAVSDKVKQLHRQMNPRTTAPDEAAATR